MKTNNKFISITLYCTVDGFVPMACKKSFLTQTNQFQSTAEATFKNRLM